LDDQEVIKICGQKISGQTGLALYGKSNPGYTSLSGRSASAPSATTRNAGQGMQDESAPNATVSDRVTPMRFPLVSVPQRVGEMIFCVHEPQYAAQDPSFGYNI
jgi:hypothetical protein